MSEVDQLRRELSEAETECDNLRQKLVLLQDAPDEESLLSVADFCEHGIGGRRFAYTAKWLRKVAQFGND